MRIKPKHIRTGSIYFLTIMIFICLSVFYRLPLSTDDWHWGLWIKQGNKLPIFDEYFFRLPVCKLIFSQIFPILIQNPILGKLTVWGIAIAGFFLILSWFFKKYGINPILLPIVSLLAFFAPNQFELNFLLSSMPFCFGFIFAGLGFYFNRKNLGALGAFFYLLSFFSLECFIVLAVLLEFLVHIETFRKRHFLKKIIGSLAPAILSYIFIRLTLHFIQPYKYETGRFFSLSQFRGFIIQCFLIDFYKLNTILSFFQLIFYGVLIYIWTSGKNAQEKRNRIISLLAIFLIIIAISSYYYFLGYAARRALAGQIAFVWATYLVFISAYLARMRKSVFVKTLIFLVLISTQIVNHARIYLVKQYNYLQIEKEVALLKKKLSEEDRKIEIDLRAIRANFKRDWIFASDKDVEIMLEFRLSPEEYKRIIIE